MRLLLVLLVSVFYFSFRPSTERAINETGNGFYVSVEDHTNRTYQKYIVESKDSVDIIFKNLFNSELELGNIKKPISILNGDYDFYVARVLVYNNSNGKKSFRHLKYPNPYVKSSKRDKLKPVVL